MMEDDDEIDVLGEFNLENLLTKNEQQITSCYDNEHQLNLHCDSRWLIDPSNQPWEDIRTDSQPDDSFLVSSNIIETSENNTWTEKERYLLEKGLELFGRSWSRLSQYIGSKSSSQVKTYVKTMGIGWSGKSSVSTSSYGVDNIDLNFTEIIDDMEIPASMEEVIAVVSTAQPTVVLPSPHSRDTTTVSNIPSARKGRRRKHHGHSCKRTHVGGRSKHSSRVYNAEEIKDVLIDNKEDDTIVMPSGELVIRMRRPESNLSEESDVDIDDNSASNSLLSDRKQHLVKQEKIEPLVKIAVKKEPIATVKAEMQVVLPKDELICEEIPLEIPTNSDFVNINKENCVIETEVQDGGEFILDVIESEVSVFTEPCEETVVSEECVGGVLEESSGITEQFVDEEVVMTETVGLEEVVEPETVFKADLITPSGKIMRVVVDDLPSLPSSKSAGGVKDENQTKATNKFATEEKLAEIRSLPPPSEERTTDPYLISGEEERLHPEFFKGQKCSPNMYLKIRNTIISRWKTAKPKYVSESSVLFGLKDNDLDMNVVRRIHAYLEQRGFINFGCAECHYNLESAMLEDSEDQLDSNDELEKVTTSMEKKKRPIGRPRKKKFLPEIDMKNNHIVSKDIKRLQKKNGVTATKRAAALKTSSWSQKQKPDSGNYTMMHTESGDTVIQPNEEPLTRTRKMSTRGIKPIRLIHCKSFTVSNKARYRVELDVSALLLVDVHSHLSPKCEVIGLLGGVFRPDSSVLTITMAVPCRTILSSNVHCDMCPVSQCESSELITGKGLSVVGWYHSHPNFDPSPSDTDVDTQNTLQSWFNKTGKPFVGLIISPYGMVAPSHSASLYRCVLVRKESNGPTPYQLETKLVNLTNQPLTSSLKKSLVSAYKTLEHYQPIRELSVHKCLESIKIHLRKASPKVEEPKIIQLTQALRDFFRFVSMKPSKESVDLIY